MNARKICVLVAEHQYFIAMEVEQILQKIAGCDVTICRRNEIDQELEARRYDLVLVDAEATVSECEDEARMIIAKGAKVAFLCADTQLSAEIDRALGLAVLEKPFTENAVIRFIEKAISPLQTG
ncbi:hypothetical protein ACQQ2Q_15930 [Agrobacterium sp. ES01]|uniref:hypothetical protein n=1 Tax=Agrobacterium sp. ES01 TaxID=3420714 RepID=UPI003D1214CD